MNQSSASNSSKHILALPKGRIFEEILPLLSSTGLAPNPCEKSDSSLSRALRIPSFRSDVDIVRVRSFDVPAFISCGAAVFGVVGSDVLKERNFPNVYAPLNLRIGKCRLSVAGMPCAVTNEEILRRGYIKIATKYPTLTKTYFHNLGIRAECIKLQGAMELAPLLGMCDRIVDLVSTGQTLLQNGLIEKEKIMDVSSYFAVNRLFYQMHTKEALDMIHMIEEARNNANF